MSIQIQFKTCSRFNLTHTNLHFISSLNFSTFIPHSAMLWFSIILLCYTLFQTDALTHNSWCLNKDNSWYIFNECAMRHKSSIILKNEITFNGGLIKFFHLVQWLSTFFALRTPKIIKRPLRTHKLFKLFTYRL